MKHPYLISAVLALLPALAIVLVVTSNGPRSAEADTEAFRCNDSSFYFPTSGIVGWTYQDPASTDRNASGGSTVHTGIDVFGEVGDGARVFAPADGVVSRHTGGDNVNLVLPEVTNVVTGETGVEVYLSHFRHSLVAGESFSAGEVIGFQAGDHIHMSVGAFIGYDDREIGQTQDPSPYFNAALSHTVAHEDRQDASYWCADGVSEAQESQGAQETQAAQAVSLTQAPEAVDVTHVVASGDTLSGIAEQYGTTVEEIVSANGLDDADHLSIGQELNIPGATNAEAPTEEPAPMDEPADETPPEQTEEYVIQDGDTIYGIADAFGVEVEAILSLNDLEDPDFLTIGDTLQIP